MSNIIDRLFTIIHSRRDAAPDDSYVASLHAGGINKVLEKIGEEATETILAAKDASQTGDNTEIIKETADLWFHTLVMLDHLGESPAGVFAELENRFGMSGHEEKLSRKS